MRERHAFGLLTVLVLCLASAFALVTSSGDAVAAESLLAFDDPADEARYAALLEEYRCLKCQNQNLADSNAGLAVDLRREIYERVVAGEPKAAIDDYLVARYGDFVLYRPRFTAATALLWIGPFALLAIALFAAFLFVRRSGTQTSAPVADEASLSEARRLLDSEGEPRERR